MKNIHLLCIRLTHKCQLEMYYHFVKNVLEYMKKNKPPHGVREKVVAYCYYSITMYELKPISGRLYLFVKQRKNETKFCDV